MPVRYLTVKEVAEVWRVSPRTVRHWVDKGAIAPEEVRRAPGGSIRLVSSVLPDPVDEGRTDS